MIDRLFLGIFISISRLFPEPLSSLKDSKFSVALLGEDMDKEMPAVSVACCRERPPSSSHFRVSEQQRNDCLFSPSAPAGACSGLPQGDGDQAPLFHAVYHLSAVRGAQLFSGATDQHHPLYLCQKRLSTHERQHSNMHFGFTYKYCS